MMKCFDKIVYKKPVLESYSAFGFFVKGASGEEDTIACTATGDNSEDDGLGLNAAADV